MPVTPIFQFGTSRFLQAHVDLFVDEALRVDQAVGAITVVQTTGDQSRAARLAALAAPAGYPVRIRGLENGQVVDREQQVKSVRRTMSTAVDWAELTRVFSTQAEYVLSNTGDKGFVPQAADTLTAFDQAMSFPAKLQLLLRARFDANARPLTVMPMELVVHNGDVLKARVLELAGEGLSTYQDWLSTKVIWANSLVDRIVSEPIEPAGAVAEPYALWAIEKADGLEPPCRHPAIQMVDDLDTIEALKLFILNLGHTWLVAFWQKMAAPPETVSALLDLPEVLDALHQLYADEVIPAFEAAGLADRSKAYVTTTIERYRNPFLQHKLSDIAQNHPQKVARRIGGFLDWAKANGDESPKPQLSELMRKETADV
jgi:tagaturonate reductase